MMRLLLLHILVLLMLPVIWHMMKHQSISWPQPAGAEPQGSPLTSFEQNYYDTIFSYSMQNVAPGQSYHWQVGRSSGDIAVGPTFTSRSHSFCRAYSESYTINGIAGTAAGYACRRGDDDDTPTWCRLTDHDALTCAMERRGFFDDIGNILR